MKNQKQLNVEAKPEAQTNNKNFTFKITNLKKQSYSKELLKTDFLDIKIGDYIKKSTLFYDLWQVTEIFRGNITEYQYKTLLSSSNNYVGKTKDISKFIELLNQYHKTLNFGACFVKMKAIITNGKLLNNVSNNSKSYSFCEMRNNNFTKKGFIKTNIQDFCLENSHQKNLINTKIKIIQEEELLRESLFISLSSLFYLDKKKEDIFVDPISITSFDGVVEYLNHEILI